MNMGMVLSLLKKDFLNLKKNSEIVAVCMLPIIMELYFLNQIPDNILLIFSANITLSMIPCMLTAGQIAQEKETNTLYTLRTVGVSARQFLVSKFLFASVFVLFVSNILYIIAFPWSFKVILFVLLTFFAAIPNMLIGAVIGIISQNQMQANMVQLPICLFMMLPVFSSNSSNKEAFLDNILPFVPTMAYQEMIEVFFLKNDNSSIHFSLAIILIYSIILLSLFVSLYRHGKKFKKIK